MGNSIEIFDPALLDVSEAVSRLKNERVIEVKRYLLQQDGQKFFQNPEVMSLLKEKGTNALPVTVVNGKVVKQGAYPSYDELCSFAEGSILTQRS